ncbi:MAG TPA: hypothetical protein VMU37_00245 [Caulobacteraceae bacterium]|nr:hypothetical protein [Caulobacteraceae bacterium]
MPEPAFGPDRLLAALPRREVGLLPAGTVVPRRRAFGDGMAYNGFTGKERYRTEGVAKWLADLGAMLRPQACDICRSPADHWHAENYYDLSSWIDLCRRCHVNLLHQRFVRPKAWAVHLDRHSVASDHWSRWVSTQEFDLAGLLRQRGASEPVYETFVEAQRP